MMMVGLLTPMEVMMVMDHHSWQQGPQHHRHHRQTFKKFHLLENRNQQNLTKKTENENSESGKGADVKSEIVKLEESSRGEGKEVASQQEKTAKGPNSEPLPNESPAVDSEIPEKEDHVMDANEEDAPAVKEESKVDTPMETSFEKQMDSGAADPPQSNFFSYFIV